MTSFSKRSTFLAAAASDLEHEGWANPWWPRAQGAKGAVAQAAAGGKAS